MVNAIAKITLWLIGLFNMASQHFRLGEPSFGASCLAYNYLIQKIGQLASFVVIRKVL